MNIAHVNGLLNEVRERLEFLDPVAMEEMAELEMQVGGHSENDSDVIKAANMRLQNLLGKLGANRSDSNKVRAYGTK